MAVTKKRLQELIDEGATVYFISDNIVHKIDLGNPPQEVDFYGDLVQTEYEVGEDLEQNFVNIEDNFFAWELENLYEHKSDAEADAEWDLEFGNVEKRIKFVKPKPFREVEGIRNQIVYDAHGLEMYIGENNIFIFTGFLFEKPFNEENYTEACRLIKKLFMEEG